MKLRGETLFNLLLIAIFAAALLFSLGWPEAARRYPMIISGAGLLLMGWLVAVSLGVFGQQSKASRPLMPGTGEQGAAAIKKATLREKDEIRSLFWMAAFGTALLLFGFWVIIFVFVPFFLHAYGGERWLLIILYTAACGALVYATFSHGLKFDLFEGALRAAW